MTTMKGSLGNGQERSVLLDPVANALIVLPNNHSYIHKGQHFKSGISDELTSEGQKLGIAVSTPGWLPWDNDNYDTMYHMVFRTWSNGPVSFGMYEDVTSFSGGTVQTPMNNNRVPTSHEYTTDLVITSGELTRTGGTLLLPLYYTGTTTGGGSNKLEGFASRDDDELLLKPGSTTLFEMTSMDNIDFYAGIEVAWYEYVPEM